MLAESAQHCMIIMKTILLVNHSSLSTRLCCPLALVIWSGALCTTPNGRSVFLRPLNCLTVFRKVTRVPCNSIHPAFNFAHSAASAWFSIPYFSSLKNVTSIGSAIGDGSPAFSGLLSCWATVRCPSRNLNLPKDLFNSASAKACSFSSSYACCLPQHQYLMLVRV